MALTFDGPNKRIVLSSGTTSLSVRDLWSRWVDWALTGDNSKYPIALEVVGGNDIDVSAGTKIPVYAYLQNGWRIRPQEASHTLNVGDGVLLVDGGGDPFVNTTGSYVVRINYQQPVQAISFDSGGGGGGLTVTQAQQLLEVYQRLGLDAAAPLTQTAAEISTPDWSLEVAQPTVGTVTVTRQ